jgi:hypothetical protein
MSRVPRDLSILILSRFKNETAEQGGAFSKRSIHDEQQRARRRAQVGCGEIGAECAKRPRAGGI